MKETIKAKFGYRFNHKKGSVFGVLYDGDEPIMRAELLSKQEHEDNMEGNECYHICEKFITTAGNYFLYTRDEESDEDFVVNLGNTKEAAK